MLSLLVFDVNLYIEIIAVILSLAFLILLIKEHPWCWPFGILSSILSVVLFYRINLYAESFLYLFYVLVGFYGWYIWTKNKKEEGFLITTWNSLKHLPLVIGGFIMALFLYLFLPKIIFFLFGETESAARDEIDSITTSFGFIATFLEAHKIFATWIYWMLINATSVWLYYDQGLQIYAALMVLYFIFSVIGFKNWRNKLKSQKSIA